MDKAGESVDEFEFPHKEVLDSLYQEPKSMKSVYMRHQSIIDPDKEQILMNYDLDVFKNSLWENFLGS